MADSNQAKAQPAKATMAPAARDPEGAGRAPAGGALERAKADKERLLRELGEALTVDERDGETEIERTRREVATLEAAVAATRNRPGRKPEAPSFGLSEGERQDLEANGVTTSPFTGERVEGDGAPRR